MNFPDFQDQNLQQGLRLPQTRRVSDAEDDEDAVAVLHQSLFLASFHLGGLAEDQLALLLLQLHRHSLLLTIRANLGKTTCKTWDVFTI